MTVGDGASDQFQYLLYDRYEAKAVGDPGVGSTGVYQCVYHSDVCVFETLFFKKIKKIFMQKNVKK